MSDNFDERQLKEAERKLIQRRYHLDEQRGCRWQLFIFIIVLLLVILVMTL